MTVCSHAVLGFLIVTSYVAILSFFQKPQTEKKKQARPKSLMIRDGATADWLRKKGRPAMLEFIRKKAKSPETAKLTPDSERLQEGLNKMGISGNE